MFIILEANFFQLCFLYKRELRISTVKQGIIKLKRFKTRSTTIPYTFLMGYRFKGTVVNCTLPSLHGGCLDITIITVPV